MTIYLKATTKAKLINALTAQGFIYDVGPTQFQCTYNGTHWCNYIGQIPNPKYLNDGEIVEGQNPYHDGYHANIYDATASDYTFPNAMILPEPNHPYNSKA